MGDTYDFLYQLLVVNYLLANSLQGTKAQVEQKQLQ
jgi:hypothetical protein